MKSALIKALLGKEARENAGKMAGNIGRFLKPEDMGRGELALALLPDAAFGLMAAGMAPAEASVVDRGAMFLGSALGGGLGGLATGAAVRKLPGVGKIAGAGLAGDMLGSIGGDMVGHQAAMGVSSLAGGGKNIYERMEGVAAEEYRKQIEQETLAKLGILPGVRHDEFMRSQGLG